MFDPSIMGVDLFAVTPINVIAAQLFCVEKNDLGDICMINYIALIKCKHKCPLFFLQVKNKPLSPWELSIFS
jgi:hypothetical protein